ncbi:MAG TPA: hypothetical protein PKD88_12195 [Nitrosomonas sp.]|nr:hypothetical protein [Nitrosomonas sp.]HMW21748.1 hypothetical protein [Nitrosomonas sp.]HMW70062.1 hypothetical protein [Nitrosomonas sp.]HMY62202.1 hypothetical protein [Nitrosomonas sp.]HMY90010.1 hypothetical protein [Nitrosomonas sp.]
MRMQIVLLAASLGFATVSLAKPSFQLDEIDRDGNTLIIKFSGNRSGNIVQDIENIHAWYNGKELGVGLPHGLYNYFWQPISGRWGADGAQISFDGRANNFLFTDLSFTPINLPAGQFLTNGDYVYDVSKFFGNALPLPQDDPAAYSEVTVRYPTLGTPSTSFAFDYHDNVTYSLSEIQIPVPGSISLIACGVLGLFLLHRRSRDKRNNLIRMIF